MKEVILTKGNVTLIDDEDLEIVSPFKWHTLDTTRGIYAGSSSGPKYQLMHRLIMNNPKGKVIDHKDHNGLNNRRSNLRICTNAENLRNSISRRGSSRYKGVAFEKRTGRWFASIIFNRRTIYLGRYRNEIDAAKEYNEAAGKYFGEFARLNNVSQ